jgi:hypothetical protein
MLIQKDGKWVFVSRKTRRPLAYYRGEGKPSEEWVRKQEQRVQFFKQGGVSEDVFGVSKVLSPILHHAEYKMAHKTLKDVMQRKKQQGSKKDVNYYASRIAQSHPNVDVKKLVKMYKEEHGAGEWGTDELRKKYQKDTPGQNIKSFKDYMKTK